MSVFVSTDVTSGARPSIPALVTLSVAGSVVLFLILSVSDTVLALLILRSVLAAHPVLFGIYINQGSDVDEFRDRVFLTWGVGPRVCC